MMTSVPLPYARSRIASLSTSSLDQPAFLFTALRSVFVIPSVKRTNWTSESAADAQSGRSAWTSFRAEASASCGSNRRGTQRMREQPSGWPSASPSGEEVIPSAQTGGEERRVEIKSVKDGKEFPLGWGRGRRFGGFLTAIGNTGV